MPLGFHESPSFQFASNDHENLALKLRHTTELGTFSSKQEAKLEDRPT